MATTIPVAHQNAHADLEAAYVDAGTAAGYVEVYTGAKPATTATTATGTLLVTITLNDPAYGTAGVTTDGVADLDVTTTVPSAEAVADGTPGWFRVYDSNGVVAHDGEIEGAAAVVTGQAVEIADGSIAMLT